MTIDIQKVQVEEVEALQKISIETFGDTFGADNSSEDLDQYYQKAYNFKQLTSEITNGASYFFFAKQADQLVGYLKVNIEEASQKKWGPTLWKLSGFTCVSNLNVGELALD